MLTPEQLKGKIRNVAKEKNLSSQEILQMYLFERVLERLSKSKYAENFILKGGFLIASMIGINERTTMDIDTTVKGLSMDKETIETIIREILLINVNDGIEFEYSRIEPIREIDDYNNFRVYFNAKYGKINNPMKMDITTGDEITPAAIKYKYPTIFGDGEIDIIAYNLETIVAEKYETIIRRNIGNTRARDYYDLYSLYKIYKDSLNTFILEEAVRKTGKKRGSLVELEDWKTVLDEISEEQAIRKLWESYCGEYAYAKKISFEDVLRTLHEIGRLVNKG
ncbi:MAG: nucleotidyl transferase AbiEii/AbiGii toxin family protein [Erysipelotrichaceae bacterium]|nr:nucleotidyl transferase AbiEii/AbiGii toxin family protein [Erysipelotrichaceae bacterium]